MAVYDRDLGALFAHGTEVVFGDGSETGGAFSETQSVVDDETGEDVLVAAPSVLVATADLPTSLAIDQALTVDGRAYQLRDKRLEDDAAVTRLYLVDGS